jgi:multicomponent Na+:H+ antiporter subunit D
MPDWVHPGAILILGSILVPLFKGRVKQAYLLVLPALAFLSVLTMSEGTYGVYHFLGQEITFGRVDKLSLAFAYIFTMMAPC